MMIICIPLEDVSGVRIKNENYHYLMDFLVKKSDSFSITLEEYSNWHISKSNYDMFDFLGKNINNIGEKVNLECDEETADEHYFKHCEPFIEKLRPHMIHEFTTTNVYGSVTPTVKHVKVIKLNEQTIKILHELNDLEDWSRTVENEGYPGDLCFHKDGKLVFSCFNGDVYAKVFSNRKADYKQLKEICGKLLLKNLKLRRVG